MVVSIPLSHFEGLMTSGALAWVRVQRFEKSTSNRKAQMSYCVIDTLVLNFRLGQLTRTKTYDVKLNKMRFNRLVKGFVVTVQISLLWLCLYTFMEGLVCRGLNRTLLKNKGIRNTESFDKLRNNVIRHTRYAIRNTQYAIRNMQVPTSR